MKETDFTINMRPDSISFECPYCESDVTVDWGDDWGETDCPNCGKAVLLGDYEVG